MEDQQPLTTPSQNKGNCYLQLKINMNITEKKEMSVFLAKLLFVGLAILAISLIAIENNYVIGISCLLVASYFLLLSTNKIKKNNIIYITVVATLSISLIFTTRITWFLVLVILFIILSLTTIHTKIAKYLQK